MKVACPECHAQFSITAALNDTAARGAMAKALGMPRAIAEPLLRYLALFRPEKRSLSFKKVERLLGQLLPMIESGEVRRNGVTRKASVAHWTEALNQVVEMRDLRKLALPLKTNGYLIEVIFSVADKADAAAERQREEDLKSGRAPSTPSDSDAAVHLSNEVAQINADCKLGIITADEAAMRIKEANSNFRRGNQ